jgi:hypothetical protein
VEHLGYREQLRAVVAASAAPYGYTLTLWTAGAVTTHAAGLPTTIDALLLLGGAVLGFGIVGAFAFGSINPVVKSPGVGHIRLWGVVHVPSVGASIVLVTLLSRLAHGLVVWPLAGFTATVTYLVVIGGQFHLAAHRRHDVG